MKTSPELALAGTEGLQTLETCTADLLLRHYLSSRDEGKNRAYQQSQPNPRAAPGDLRSRCWQARDEFFTQVTGFQGKCQVLMR